MFFYRYFRCLRVNKAERRTLKKRAAEVVHYTSVFSYPDVTHPDTKSYKSSSHARKHFVLH